MRLIYTGGGYGGFLPDIPARDLTDEEVKRYGEGVLLTSGLYVQQANKNTGKHGTVSQATPENDGNDSVSEAARATQDLKE